MPATTSLPVRGVVRDNKDGTSTVRIIGPDGKTKEMTVDSATLGTTTADPTQTEILVAGAAPMGRPVRASSDCLWCRYGKPAAAGAVAGLALAAIAGYEPTRGAIWGGVGGLLFGHVRG